MVEEILQEFAKARYLEWESTSQLHLQKQQELREICEWALQHELESTSDNGVTASTQSDGREPNDLEGKSESYENSLKVKSEITHKE